jgi:hypothetical protein
MTDKHCKCYSLIPVYYKTDDEKVQRVTIHNAPDAIPLTLAKLYEELNEIDGDVMSGFDALDIRRATVSFRAIDSASTKFHDSADAIANDSVNGILLAAGTSTVSALRTEVGKMVDKYPQAIVCSEIHDRYMLHQGSICVKPCISLKPISRVPMYETDMNPHRRLALVIDLIEQQKLRDPKTVDALISEKVGNQLVAQLKLNVYIVPEDDALYFSTAKLFATYPGLRGRTGWFELFVPDVVPSTESGIRFWKCQVSAADLKEFFGENATLVQHVLRLRKKNEEVPKEK